MTPDKARRIIAQAKADEIYEGPIPEEDAIAVKEAEGLVEMARQAWSQMVRGPEVEAIIRIDDEKFDGTPQAEEEPEQEEQEQNPITSVEPWEGYDTDKIPDILKLITRVAAEEDQDEALIIFEHTWAYEKANRNRQTILNALEKQSKRIAEEINDEKAPEEALEEEPQGEAEPEESREESVPEPEAEELGGDEERPELRDSGEPGSDDVAVGVRDGSGDAGTEPRDEAPQPSGEGEDLEAEEAQEDSGSGNSEDGKLTNGYLKIIGEVDADLREHFAPIDKPEFDELPKIPWDWTRETTEDLMTLYSAYSALAYMKNYMITREERIALECKRAADELASALIARIDKYDDHGKEKKVTFVEAEAEADPNVSAWRTMQRRHEAWASSARRERDAYYKIVEQLSRFATMRHQEWERSHQ